jgi:hypothetical protein
MNTFYHGDTEIWRKMERWKDGEIRNLPADSRRRVATAGTENWLQYIESYLVTTHAPALFSAVTVKISL